MKAIAHIIAAAGSGTRFGAPLPKQFCPLGGRPLLMTTIERLREASAGADSMMVVVLNAWMIDEWLDMCIEHDFRSPTIVEGGATRWESVANAIAAIPPSVRVISVHDGARPVISPRLVAAVLSPVLEGHQGALPAVPVTDSVRRLLPDGTSVAEDRSLLRAVQTPQAFRADLLRDAYSRPYRPEFTDDASVMEAAGYRDIALVEGDPANIKVTHPADLLLAARLLTGDNGI